jgi:hypothetical protein
MYLFSTFLGDFDRNDDVVRSSPESRCCQDVPVQAQFSIVTKLFPAAGRKYVLPSLAASATVPTQDEAEIVFLETGIRAHPLNTLVRPIEADKRGDQNQTYLSRNRTYTP